MPLKLLRLLATSLNNTYLKIGNGGIQDMDLIANSVAQTTLVVHGYVQDTTRPWRTQYMASGGPHAHD